MPGVHAPAPRRIFCRGASQWRAPVAKIGVDAIERILAATGEKHIPPDLDTDRLTVGLDRCLATYDAAVAGKSDTPVTKKIPPPKSIRAAAVRFKQQLMSDEIWTSQDWEAEYVSEEVGYMIQRLDWKINDLSHELEWGPDFDEAMRLNRSPREYADRWKSHSPLE